MESAHCGGNYVKLVRKDKPRRIYHFYLGAQMF